MKVGVFYGYTYPNWFPAKVSLNTLLISYGNILLIAEQSEPFIRSYVEGFTESDAVIK